MKSETKKVFVGLSGGVDSSVSALLLKEAGYHVTGVFIKAWYPDFIPCNWREEMRDAMRVCAKLEIPFLVCDLEKEYKKEVIDNLIEEYSIGNTPNPDVLCNKQIKFGGFLEFAEYHDADFVATGHYVQTKDVDGVVRMLNSKDTEKDQTYFLWTLPTEKLEKILFPIGHLKKPEVRKIAEKYNLHTAEKKDSQGLCFIGHVDMKEFLKRYIDTEHGDVLNEAGEQIGTHEGAVLYTLGERHGFKIDNSKSDEGIHYVVSKDLDKNTITVSNRENKKPEITEISLNNVVLNRKEMVGKNIQIRTLYRGKLYDVTLDTEDKVKSSVEIPNVAVGQSVVFYHNNECLGGGIVSKTM